jgi:transcriptional regulator with XRE-family HTH domain
MPNETRNAAVVLVARVEALRRGKAWTIGDLAERAEISPELLECFLADTPDVGVSVILRLAGALGVEPEELLRGIEWVPDGRGGGEYRVGDPDR